MPTRWLRGVSTTFLVTCRPSGCQVQYTGFSLLKALSLHRYLVRLLILATVMLIATPAIAVSPKQQISTLVHTPWALRESAPSSVLAIAQDLQGGLWLGTGAGVFRFDGNEFEQFRSDGRTSLSSEMVSDLAATLSGDVWVGYQAGGVSRIRNGRITTYSAGLPAGPVKQFAEARDGAIWVATFGGVAVFRDGAWKAATWSADYGRAFNIAVARDGTVWIATARALLFVRPGTSTIERSGEPVEGAWALAEAPDGRLWLSDEARGLRPLDVASLKGRAPAVRRVAASAPLKTRQILFDRDGVLWGTFLDRAGIFRILEPSRFPSGAPLPASAATDTYAAEHGLTSDAAVPIFEDRERNIWVGTDLGLDRFRTADIQIASSIPKRPGDGYRATIDPQGRLVVADGGTIYRELKNSHFQVVGHDPWHPNELCAGRRGSTWLVNNDGVRRIDDQGIIHVKAPPVIKGREVMSCAVDTDGALWISVRDVGVFVQSRGVWKGPLPSLIQEKFYPYLLVANHHGGVWGLARGSAVFLIRDGTTTRLSASEGLSVGDIKTVYSGANFTLVGGELGLAMYERGAFTSLNSTAYPDLSLINGIMEGELGETWLSAAHGVIRLQTTDLLKAIKTQRGAIPLRVFDGKDGAPGRMQQTCCTPNILKGRSGKMWLLTTRGVASLDPRNLSYNPLPPAVAIRSVIVNGIAIPLSGKLQFPPAVSTVRFEYSAISLSVPERMKFKYRLKGFDDRWVDSANKQVVFTKLPPGRYEFSVSAANNDGVWNNRGASVGFVIPPTFLQSRAFAVLGIISALAAISVAYIWQARRLTVRIRDRLEARATERERIARELHDTLLQGVQGLMLRFGSIADQIPPDDVIRREIDGALTKGEQVIEESRDRILDLRTSGSARTLVQRLEQIESEFEGRSGARLLVSADRDIRDLTPVVLEELSMIGAEAIRNAFRYARARTIVAEIIQEEGQLRLIVHDDGVGLDPQLLQGGQRDGHFGLPGIRERARRIGAKLRLSNRDGARVEVSVPAHRAYRGRARWWNHLRLLPAEKPRT